MAVVSYKVTLYDPFGANPISINSFSLEAVRTVNSVGALVLEVPASQYSFSIFRKDSRLFVERQADYNTAWQILGDTVWFVRKKQLTLKSDGSYVIKVTAFDTVHLLKRRINAYPTGDSRTEITDYADDIMVDIFNNNLGSTATDTSRDLSAYIGVQPVQSAAGGLVNLQITKSFGWRNVLAVMQELALTNERVTGYYLAFDIVASSPSTLTFRTFVLQRGLNRLGFPNSVNLFTFDPTFGNISEITYEEDSAGEITAAYVGGAGEDEDREIGQAEDGERIAQSPFGRIELFRDSRNVDDPDALDDDAEGEVQRSRSIYKFTARALPTPTSRYGIDFGFGDIVVVVLPYPIDVNSLGNTTFACRIDTVRWKYANLQETVDLQLSSEGALGDY